MEDIAHQHAARDSKNQFGHLCGLEITRRAVALRRTRDQVGHAVDRRSYDIADHLRDLRVARRFCIKIDNKSGLQLWRLLAAMGGEKNLKGLEQRRSLAGLLEQRADLFLVPIGHRRDDRFLVREVAVDQANADTSFRADIVHAGLVKPALRKRGDRRLQNLIAAVERKVVTG